MLTAIDVIEPNAFLSFFPTYTIGYDKEYAVDLAISIIQQIACDFSPFPCDLLQLIVSSGNLSPKNCKPDCQVFIGTIEGYKVDHAYIDYLIDDDGNIDLSEVDTLEIAEEIGCEDVQIVQAGEEFFAIPKKTNELITDLKYLHKKLFEFSTNKIREFEEWQEVEEYISNNIE